MQIYPKWSEPRPYTLSSFVARLSVDDVESLQSSYPLIESFVTPGFLIKVLIDAIPIHSFSVFVTPLEQNHNFTEHPNPVRFHFGCSFNSSCDEWIDPRDLYFQKLSPVSFRTSYEFPPHSPLPSSISFVIQCTDHQWIRYHNDKDFHVGSVNSSPSCVELPFRWPITEITNAKVFSLHRVNPFWLVPNFPSTVSKCMDETFFILANVNSPVRLPKYCAIIFCVDPSSGLRSSLFPTSSNSGTAIRIESGLNYPLSVSKLHDSLVAVLKFDDCPYQAIQSLIQSLVHVGVNISTRLEKISSPNYVSFLNPKTSPLLSTVGFCTWDAFSTSVSRLSISKAVKWLQASNIPIGFVIVDDGWQQISDQVNQNEHPTLLDFKANEQFSECLENVVSDNQLPVYAWTTVVGYWGGFNSSAEGIETIVVGGMNARGLLRNDVDDLQMWQKKYSIPTPDRANLIQFFKRYFIENLAQIQKVCGVKIDGQSLLTFANANLQNFDTNMTRYKLATFYRIAMTEVLTSAFPKSVVLNCMACSPENIFSSGSTISSSNICWRTSNDHAFPNVKECTSAVAWHIVSNAMNTLLLGEIFPVPDWDMFRAADVDDGHAFLHAVARVLSGGPLYISDTTPFTDNISSKALKLLKSLFTDDGFILRCHDVGRPTIDSFFHHPMEDKSSGLFKIFNRNSINGIVAAFNFHAMETVRGTISPADILDFDRLKPSPSFLSFVVHDDNNQSVHFHHDKDEELSITVGSYGVAVIHFCPIFKIDSAIQICVVGQPRFVNCGGVVSSISYCQRKYIMRSPTSIYIDLASCGETLLWLEAGSRLDSATLRTASGLKRFNSTEKIVIDNITLTRIKVPSLSPYFIEIQIE